MEPIVNHTPSSLASAYTDILPSAVTLVALGVILTFAAHQTFVQGGSLIGFWFLAGEAGVSFAGALVFLVLSTIPLPRPKPPPPPPPSPTLLQQELHTLGLTEESVPTVQNHHGETALNRAAEQGLTTLLHTWATNLGTPVLLTKNRRGDIPLHAAIATCQSETACWLAKCKVGVNQPNLEGFSPLQQVADLKVMDFKQAQQMTKALVEHGGEVGICDSSANNLFHKAAIADNAGAIVELMVHIPEMVNDANIGKDTPLKLAMRHNSKEAILQLIQYVPIDEELWSFFAELQTSYLKEDFLSIQQKLRAKMEETRDGR